MVSILASCEILSSPDCGRSLIDAAGLGPDTFHFVSPRGIFFACKFIFTEDYLLLGLYSS